MKSFKTAKPFYEEDVILEQKSYQTKKNKKSLFSAFIKDPKKQTAFESNINDVLSHEYWENLLSNCNIKTV
jgi:hypothetical protein